MNKLSNRERLLQLWLTIKDHSDETSPITLQDIIELSGIDYTNSVRADIATLVAEGIIVEIHHKNGLPKTYYHKAFFSPHQVQFLIESLATARFLTDDVKQQMLTNFGQLVKLDDMPNLSTVWTNQQRESVVDSDTTAYIDALQEAVDKRCHIELLYGKYNARKERVLSNDGNPYLLMPYALFRRQDFLYLVARKDEEWRHFRIDRICGLTVRHDLPFEREPFHLRTHLQSSFLLHTGQEEQIILRVKNELAPVMIDKFGMSVDMKPVDDWFILTVKSAVSRGFIRWVLTWGQEIQVLQPATLVERVKAEIEAMSSLYR